MGTGDEAAGAAAPLLVVPGAQLHKVAGGVQELLVAGPFSVGVRGARPDEQRVVADVGGVEFALGKQLPALKAASTIYSFGLADSKDVYYILVLPPDTPGEVLDALHDVLHDVCALSTVKQLDAAYEEADRLQGGKESRARRARRHKASRATPRSRWLALRARSTPRFRRLLKRAWRSRRAWRLARRT